ncbi:hypothetical protein D9C73_000046 [Collichthys lucidus]|uniref:Uncharacterized protein n=1 Tax=Collichthys lucidus TaxID=240159 RepID=A0A4U5TWZ0_COLLU|nr:hypothetical protein D9C73_000046 [Collichthys lucidus]
MEAGKQLPSLESGGYRFGEELVSFCKNWTPMSNELRRLLKNRLTSDQFQRIATDLDGDYHQEQSEWGAAGAHERVPGEASEGEVEEEDKHKKTMQRMIRMEKGHWARDCPKKKKEEKGTSIFASD